MSTLRNLMLTAGAGSALLSCSQIHPSKESLHLESVDGAKKRNVIFILTDDHRYDFMGFTDKVPWLETPNMDRLANEGAYFPNAFVTTSLCSPSRASILTGLYSHSHTIVDNVAPEPEGLTYFPQYLQQAGYQTAFLGKWHMGDKGDQPRPGFNHWESFEGQGVYYNPTLNIDGERITYGDSTYITDLLTDHAINWLDNRDPDKPFFLYLSHKAVHDPFTPPTRYKGTYNGKEIAYPASYDQTKDDTYKEDKYHWPEWVKKQRHSWHGVDYMYHGAIDFERFYTKYCECLRGVDESVGNVMEWLKENNLDESTMVIYMGDNGFSFGEHGLIDKRHFYEESVKVPFLVRCPEIFEGGEPIPSMVQNIDVAPTILACAGLNKPSEMPGKNFLPVLNGNTDDARKKVFYEYYWEYDFPMTPTVFGVRTDRYKYIRYYGLWDTNEFYDLESDPDELHNLIAVPEYQDSIKRMANELYDWMETTNGMQIPLKRTVKYPFGDYLHKNQY